MTQQWNKGTEDDVQMPLGVGDGGGMGDGEPGAEPKKSKVSGPTFILVGAFASALAVIYLLGMQNRPRAASAEQVAREQHTNSAISELLAKNGKAEQLQGLFKDTRKLVKMFYSYLGTQQSEIPQLTHDPFGESEVVAVKPAENEAVKIVSTNPAEAEKLRQVAEAFGALKLQSVMLGRTPVAMINNRMVQTGNKIGDLTVVSIEADRVLLSYEKSTFALTIAHLDMEKK